MNKVVFFNGHRSLVFRAWWLSILLSIVTFGCGGSDNSQPTPPPETSAVVSINWQRSQVDEQNTPNSEETDTTAWNCIGDGVEIAECLVYDDAGDLKNFYECSCSEDEVILTKLSPGTNRQIVIFGLDSENNVVYRGESTEGVTITAGQTVNVGTIDAYPFVPSGLSPDTVSHNQIQISWATPDEGAGVFGYQIYSADGNLIEELNDVVPYTHSGLSEATQYCYRLSAYDRFKNLSKKSEPLCVVTHGSLQITDNDHDDDGPRINDDGVVVWRGKDGQDYDIFLYDGANTRKITDNNNDEQKPQINNNGYVVWHGFDGQDWEIYLYDGSSIRQMTDNSRPDVWPKISNNNHIVWYGHDGSDWEVFFYDGSNISKITDNSYDDEWLHINSHGHVVWHGGEESNREIFLYDGSNIHQLTDNSYDDKLPQINNQGQIVWHGLYEALDWEIFYYDGSNIHRLTDNNHNDESPQINNQGHIVWHGDDGSDQEIFLYDGSVTHQLTDNIHDDIWPLINSNGAIVWTGSDGLNFELFSYFNSNVHQITDSISDNEAPHVNSAGQIVWVGGDDTDAEIQYGSIHN